MNQEKIEQEMLNLIKKERRRVVNLGRTYGWEGEQGAVWSYYSDKLEWIENRIKETLFFR